MSFVYCQRLQIHNSNLTNASLIINEHFEEIQRLSTATALLDFVIPYSTTPKVITKYLAENQSREYLLTFRATRLLHPTPTTPTTEIEATVEWIEVNGKNELKARTFTNDTE